MTDADAGARSRAVRAAAGRAALLLGGLLLLGTQGRASEPTPLELLERMNEAVRVLDYAGHFVVQVGDRLDALHIVHRVDNGAERERVVSLTGKPREIVRGDQVVACPVPGRDRKVNVDRRAHGRSFSPLGGVSAEQLGRSYDIAMLPPGRVAGRDAYQLLVRPRDDLRYGYRLFIDRESSLPLRSIMFDEAQRPVTQMMFIDLEVGEGVEPIGEVPAAAAAVTPPLADEPLATERLARPAWTFNELPPGFQLNVHRRRPLAAESGGESEHFIFSDGLASVSVYIQPHHGSGGLNGESALGSARAVGRILDAHEVIVVGEVPVKTLHWFAQHVQPTPR